MSLRSQPRSRARAQPYLTWFRASVITASVAVAIFGLHLMAVASSGFLLAVPGAPIPVDTIVVLGGDGPARAEKAVELWQAGLANNAIVAGDGDCTYIRDAMVEGGVPRAAITIECLSGNTWMNAVNSAPLLEGLRTRSAIIVTSWFHTGRAMRVFQLICPGIQWFPVATEQPASLLDAAFGHYGPAVAKEYVKAAAYRAREWLLSLDSPLPGDACLRAGSGR